MKKFLNGRKNVGATTELHSIMTTLQDWLDLRNGTDVRGVATEGVEGEHVTLTPQAAEKIAAAFCLWLKERKITAEVGFARPLQIAVGHDSRISAAALTDAAARGIANTGAHAVTTGLSSTPSMFMLLKDENRKKADGEYDGSVMITASHLPFNRNGLKFFTPEGGLEGGDIKAILTLAYSLSSQEDGSANKGAKTGSITDKPYIDEYAAALTEKVRAATGSEKPLAGKRIIVDAGNGAGGFYATKVLQPLGADITGSQFLDPDGTFPNHIPNPENQAAMQSVCNAVKDNRADFGIIFDTDVDRAGAVDKSGEEINRNALIALISAILLSEKTGTIVTDSVTSNGLTQFIRARGGKHHRFKRGYKNVIDEAIRLNKNGEYAPLAIETSGHAALKENYFLDDGAYLVTRILIALAKETKNGGDISKLIADLPRPAEAAEIRPTFAAGVDFKARGAEILSDLASYANNFPFLSPASENYEGIRLNYDEPHGDGWSLVRMSLHEPIMPINAESDSVGGVKKIIAFLYEFLKKYDCLNLSSMEKFLSVPPIKK